MYKFFQQSSTLFDREGKINYTSYIDKYNIQPFTYRYFLMVVLENLSNVIKIILVKVRASKGHCLCPGLFLMRCDLIFIYYFILVFKNL